jgi:TolA-binding protein
MVSGEATNINPPRNIEEANILFQDGEVYRNSFSIIKKKSKLRLAETRYKKILNDYPESDKADDAAYELADIYDSYYFKDYEAAAFYYVKCYHLNAFTEKPARFKAASVYDKHLKDFKEAVNNYSEVMKYSTDEADRYIAKTRLKELKEKGY